MCRCMSSRSTRRRIKNIKKKEGGDQLVIPFSFLAIELVIELQPTRIRVDKLGRLGIGFGITTCEVFVHSVAEIYKGKECQHMQEREQLRDAKAVQKVQTDPATVSTSAARVELPISLKSDNFHIAGQGYLEVGVTIKHTSIVVCRSIGDSGIGSPRTTQFRSVLQKRGIQEVPDEAGQQERRCYDEQDDPYCIPPILCDHGCHGFERVHT